MAKGERAPRRWCYCCKKTLQAGAFDSPPKSKGDCRVCCGKPKRTGPTVGNEFDASKVQAASERLILEMRAKCGMR